MIRLLPLDEVPLKLNSRPLKLILTNHENFNWNVIKVKTFSSQGSGLPVVIFITGSPSMQTKITNLALRTGETSPENFEGLLNSSKRFKGI
jgi:hypothetical protein